MDVVHLMQYICGKAWIAQMLTKDFIVAEIQRIAKKLGRPPGRMVFEKETGIRKSEWSGVHWRNWSEAVEEAGFPPNRKQERYSQEAVLRKFADAVRFFGRVPVEIDIRMYSRENPEFPSHSTFLSHFSGKAHLVSAFSEFVRTNAEFADLVAITPEPYETPHEHQRTSYDKEGWVYLLRSGGHFKIGRSDELERRVRQISIALPEAVTLEHSIRTDDPVGIEAYWHRRFSDRRTNGEWFKLTADDIRAFKRRKFQ